MNHQTITSQVVTIALAFFLFIPFTSLFAKAYDDSANKKPDADDLWVVGAQRRDSFALFKYLSDNGYVDDSVTFGDFDYICVLTEQLCTMTNQVSPDIALAMIAVESNFDTNQKTDSARGLMQLIPVYHSKRMEAFVEEGHQIDLDDFFDPRLNIATGLDYLDYILEETKGDVDYALMWYNQGATSASKDYIDHRRISSYTRKVKELASIIHLYLREEEH